MTSTEWEWERRNGLIEVRTTFADGDGRDMRIVLYESAHGIARALYGPRAAVHGPLFQSVEDVVLGAFDVPLGWDRRTGLRLP
jgi:hypothetical protein